ncbi:hypothetical protein O0Z71_05845 [Ligilactobacillus saerimneri]|uniref:hypothetical protein n=1 Tax=Ligilactobacillus saerimneri TaxID=228229 RepID=UPI0022A6FA88|nr:hypothetical protein [Ligilactobacillus saerimneri]MCZ0891961.1 hypothetical protein [Ligilactobacillus saerimneri]
MIVGNWNLKEFDSLPDYQGQKMTIRVWIDKPASPTRVNIWTNKGGLYGNPIETGKSGYSTVTGVIPTGFTNWNIVIGGTIDNNELSYKELKLELGAVPTPWSPAPDDLEGDNQ